jgi:Arc/MetJ-type ribon-helix-helix transcriptional regulator
MKAKIEIELAPRLLQQIQGLVDEGWFKSVSDFLDTAGRYYLERHTDEMWENYIEHEIKAGLHEQH